MKRIVYLLVFALLAAFGVKAQTEKTPIAILKLNAQPALAVYAPLVQDLIEKGFLKTNRYKVLERAQIDKLQDEMKLQEVLSDQQMAEVGKTLGAKMVILGNLSAVVADAQFAKDEKTGNSVFSGMRAVVSVQMKVVEVETGQILASEMIQTEGGTSGTSGNNEKSKQVAIDQAMRAIDNRVQQFIVKNFPITVDFVQITQMTKRNDGAEMVEVLIGKAHGVVQRDRLDIVTELTREVNGRKIVSKKKIGEVRIETIDGDEISTCKVVNGNKEIKQAVDAKTPLKAVFSGKNNALFNQRLMD